MPFPLLVISSYCFVEEIVEVAMEKRRDLLDRLRSLSPSTLPIRNQRVDDPRITGSSILLLLTPPSTNYESHKSLAL